jgi:hypothetical protein
MRCWREANRERVRADKRLYYRRHKKRLLERERIKNQDPEQKRKNRARWQRWYRADPANRGAVIDRGRQWAKANPARMQEMHHRSWHKRYPVNKDKLKLWRNEPNRRARRLIYMREANALPHVKARKKRWYYANRDKVTTRVRERRRKDIAFRLRGSLRRRIWEALRGKQKSARTMQLVGCSIEQLKAHLQTKFALGMSWENYGRNGWHVDHIGPCSHFDLLLPEQQGRCFHFSNLQPLWEVDNLRKQDKLIAA